MSQDTERARKGVCRHDRIPAVVSFLFLSFFNVVSAQTWTSQDIGAVNNAGTYSYNSTTGVYTLQGNGADIWGTADAFHFVYQTISGDGELEARVTSVQNTDAWAKVGVMVRQSTTAGSIQAMTVVTPGNGVSFIYRPTAGGTSNNAARVSTVASPWWVKIVKDGNIVTSYQSPDGNSWTLLGYTQLTFTGPVDIGLAVTSHTTNNTLCTATFDNVSLVTQSSFAPPAPWLDQDIGSTGITGKVHYEATQWSMYGSGADIWNNADAFHFAYQSLTGDGSIITQVSGLTNTNSWTKAGVMIRQDLTAGSANALVAVTPGNGVAFQYRTSAGGSSTTVAGARVTAPYWVKLTRSGNQLYAYQSSDGSTWQQVGTQTISMPSQIYIGLVETSHNNSALALGIFNNVQTASLALTANSYTDTSVNLIWPSLANPSLVAQYEIDRNGTAVGYTTQTNFGDIQLTPSTTYSYQVKALSSSNSVLATSSTLTLTTSAPWLPSPWTHLDIGQVYLGGSTQFDTTTSTYTQIGSGADIQGSADAFQFAYQPLNGDGQIIARVRSVTNTNSWAKAGIMLRETNNTGSKNILLALTPGNGVTLQQRTTTNGGTGYTKAPAQGPVWLKLLRHGSTVSAYTSPDGANWTLMSSTSLALNTALEAGLALSSHDITQAATSVIDNVSISAGIPTETQPPSAPGTPTSVVIGDASLTIKWPPASDSVGVSGYQILRNGQVVGQTGNNLQFTDTGLAPGQNYTYTVKAINLGGLVSSPSGSLNITTTSSTLPSPWQHQEIGTVALAGSASYAENVFTISASGDDIWNSADGFGFTYQTLRGDGTITARVSGLTNTNVWTKAGVMLRQSLDPGSLHVFMLVSAANGLALQSRATQGGGSTSQAGATSVAPVWVRLVRSGSVFTGYSSADGVNWTYVSQQTLILNTTLYAGLAVTSHQNGVLATATFDHVSAVAVDSDGNGLPDAWEMQYFGHIGNDPNSSPDGNGFTLLQDYQSGANPTNYYSQPNPNGPGAILITPTITIVGGNNQTSTAGNFAPQSLVVQVTNSNGGAALIHAPVTFTVALTTPPGGQLATDPLGVTSTTLQVTTDINGQAQVSYQQATGPGVTGQINATTANQSVTFTEKSSDTVPAPAITPAAGHYATQQNVTVTCAMSGVTIYYTTDGTDPTTSSASIASGGTISVTQTEVLKVMAGATGFNSSPIATEVYQIGSDDLAAGDSFTMVRKPDGTVWTWGEDIRGQQGDQTSNPYHNAVVVPQQVPNLSGMTNVSAAGDHALAVDSNSHVWAWGADDYSQCGDGGTTDLFEPTAISGLSNIAAVYAGQNNGFAVDTNGNLYGWGDNTYGQLGDGTTTNRSTPEAITSITGIVKIASGLTHTLALKSDGTVWATGLNDVDQLGDGTNNNASIFQPVPGLSHVVDIAAGGIHSMALLSDGTVWTWGWSSNGQLGDGNNDFAPTPQQIVGLPPAMAIEAVDTKSYVILADGTVRCFGGGFEGEMGVGTTQDQLSPVQPAGMANVRLLAAGTFHAVVCTTAGAFYGWGDNSSFRLTQDFNNFQRNTEVHDNSLQGYVNVASAGNASMGLKNDGTVWATGDGSIGLLGNGAWHSTKEPVEVIGLNDATHHVTTIAGGGFAAFVIRNDGTLWGWGANWDGQLGIGNYISQNTPSHVSTGHSVIAVAGGNNHTLLVQSDGTVWAMGDDSRGELGDGTTNIEDAPVQVADLLDVYTETATAVAAGTNTSFALASDGTVWAWGQNDAGQLGLGTTGDVGTPTQMSFPEGVTIVAIAASGTNGMGLDSTGNVWGWGSLGNSDGTPKLSGLSNVKAIATSSINQLAIKNDGTLWGWGDGAQGQLGNGSYNGQGTPTQFNDVQGVTAIAAAYGETFVVKADGSLSGFGASSLGQLASNLGVYNYSPKSLFGIAMNETPPTVSISSPSTGTSSPMGTAIQFQTSASASTGSISKVEYYLEGVKLGQSTAGGSWNFSWTPTSFGDYTFEAVAYDSAGVAQISAPITINVPYDSDSNGLPDWWELKYVEQLGNDPNAQSPAGDGYTLLQEYQFGADPTQGIAPTITILSGNNQTGPSGAFLPNALVVTVNNANAAGKPLPNFPVTYSVAQGRGLVSVSPNGTPSISAQVTTDNNGGAQIYFKQPLVANYTSTINTVTGQSVSTFTSTTPVNNASPAAPGNFAGVVGGSGEIDLSWTNNADNATSIQVQQQNNDGSWSTIGNLSPDQSSYAVTGLTLGLNYNFQLLALNAIGQSVVGLSAPIEAKPTARYAVIALDQGQSQTLYPFLLNNNGSVVLSDQAQTPHYYFWANGQLTALPADFAPNDLNNNDIVSGGLTSASAATWNLSAGETTLSPPSMPSQELYHIPNNDWPGLITYNFDHTALHSVFDKSTVLIDDSNNVYSEFVALYVGSYTINGQVYSGISAVGSGTADTFGTSQGNLCDITFGSIASPQLELPSNERRYGIGGINIYGCETNGQGIIIGIYRDSIHNTSGAMYYNGGINPVASNINLASINSSGEILAYDSTANALTVVNSNFQLPVPNSASITYQSGANKIFWNSAHQIVGGGYLWEPTTDTYPTGLYKLSDLVDPSSGWSNIYTYNGIANWTKQLNDSGAIVGTATKTSDGSSHGVMLVPIQLRVTTRDDPTQTWANNVLQPGLVPVYGGQNNGDMVSWKLGGTDSWTSATFAWSVTDSNGNPVVDQNGVAITGPSGAGVNSWTIATWSAGGNDPANQWLTWKPGTYNITCTIDGTTSTTFQQVVGQRTKDVVVIGWINESNVPLPTSGVDGDVLAYFPSNDIFSGLVQQTLTTAYLGEIAAGQTQRPLIGLLSSTDKIYILNWMFRFGGNAEPPHSFADESTLEAFNNVKTNYKLFNRLQFKYLVNGSYFSGRPVFTLPSSIPKTDIGNTVDPIWGSTIPAHPGTPGLENGELISPDNSTIHQINEGSPASPPVYAFNTLMSPLRWNDIGSRIDEGVPLDQGTPPVTGYTVENQVYPTYYIYERQSDGSFLLITTIPQASSPSGNFNSDPYCSIPPINQGPAPFLFPQ